MEDTELTSFHKELDLIQGIINRMANNSFIIKGWVISLVAALIAFGKETIFTEKGVYFLILVFLVVLPFWWMDWFYLNKERRFRAVYSKVINDPQCKDRLRFDFSNCEKVTAVLNAKKKTNSRITTWFYLPVLALLITFLILKLTHNL